MIAVDTSALYAIALAESDGEDYFALIEETDRALVGAPTLFELRLTISKRLGRSGLVIVDKIVARLDLEIVPWTAAHIVLATDALLRFGGRPARLNYGDCMAYAVAKVAGCPLLFKGDDFHHTDMRSAF